MSKEIYIIDGSAYIYRAYHAVAPLTNSSGFPTHAVYGFINIVRRLIKDKNPQNIMVAWDSRGPVFRHEMYEEYKANRPPMPEDLVCQLPYIKRYVEALNISSVEIVGVEADDIIATAALAFGEAGSKVVIVSGDKDLLQLVGGNIVLWDPMKNKTMDVEAVEQKYGVLPEQLLDCFALMGDSSDNVPGVPGVGPKTAQKLIMEYGGLDNLYEKIDDLKKSKMKEKLINNYDKAILSRDLIRLKEDVKMDLDPRNYGLHGANDDKLRELYSELEFSSLLKEVEKMEPIPVEGFTLVQSEGQLQEIADKLKKATLLVIDTETTSLNAREAELVGISLATDLEQAYYVPVGHRTEDDELVDEQLDLEVVLRILRPLFVSSIPKLGHNLKYDYTVLKNYQIELAQPLVDSMLAAYLLDPARRTLKLDDLCKEEGVELTSFIEVVEGDKRANCFAYVSLEKACNYSCEDVYGALLIWQKMEKELEDSSLKELLFDVEAPLIPILAEMEITGIALDCNRLQELKKEFGDKLVELERKIHELAGKEFNINSPSQLGTILFDELGLPHGRKTKTGYSTDIKVLEKLSPKHPLPKEIIAYRNLNKLQSTYVEKLAVLADPQTARVHTSFNQAITATGRLSSSNPNMQNIPIRTQEGAKIRQVFVSGEGKSFLSADYSQIDLRVLAHYSKDKALVSAFNSGADIHARTAALIFGVSEMLITPEMRRVAKSINFGIVYGMSAFGLSQQLEISRKEAQQFIDRYFSHYQGVKRFMEEIVVQAREDGYVTTLLKRRRYLPEINAANKTRREFAERAAINTPIQGTAADIIKLAMINVDQALNKLKYTGHMLLQVHDELVFELDEDAVEVVRPVLKDEMENALSLDVPLVVNMEVGSSLAK